MCKPVNDVGCEIDWGNTSVLVFSCNDLVVFFSFLPAAHHVSRRGASECGGEEDEGGA